MTLIFNAAAFNNIRPAGKHYSLRKLEKPVAYGRGTDDPLKLVLLFARSAGMDSLPGRTVWMLRHHPYFRYAFYPMIREADPFDLKSYFGQHRRKRLVKLLKHPDLLDDRDIYLGLQGYINNFICFLPGGMYRDPSRMDPEDFQAIKPIRDAVDRTLSDLQKSAREAESLHKKMKREMFSLTDYSKRAAFMKLALEVFNLLVDKYGFKPDKLWH